jgi:sulfoacetaldehyde dehydrogenase
VIAFMCRLRAGGRARGPCAVTDRAIAAEDAGADAADAAAAIRRAKTFDYATSCLADNSVIAHAAIYDDLVARLTDGGAHLCDDQQKDALRALMWPDGGAVPAIAVVAKSATHIAELAGFQVGQDCPMLLVEESGTGQDHPFSSEKLSVVFAVYRYEGDIDAAAELVNDITDYQGLGHTCGIHTRSDANVERLALTTRTARVLVNQNLNEGAGKPAQRSAVHAQPQLRHLGRQHHHRERQRAANRA